MSNTVRMPSLDGIEQAIRAALEAARDPDPKQVQSAIRALQDARTTLMVRATFYGAIASRLKLVSAPRTAQGTAATDGHSLYFNAVWVLAQTHRKLVGLIAHEVMHIAHKHPLRRGWRDVREWNIACDLAINNALLAAGFELPDDGYCDPQYRGWSAEEIYDHRNPPGSQHSRNPQPQPQSEVVCGYPGAGGNGEPQDGNQQPPPSGKGGKSAPAKVRDAIEHAKDVARNKWNEACDAAVNELLADAGYEMPQPGDSHESEMPAGGVLDSPDPVGDESRIDVMIVQAGMCAKAAGNVPGDIKRLIDAVTKRRDVDWQSELAEFVSVHLQNDYTMAHPSRRYLSAGFYLPSLRSTATPELAFFIDTSGSINKRQLTRAVSALEDAIATCNPERVHIKAGDTRPRWRATRERGDALDVQAPGGGGTRFSPFFAELNEEGIEPACAVYFTADCDTYDFGPEPEYPVLWICEKGHRVPPWGRVIVMDDAPRA